MNKNLHPDRFLPPYEGEPIGRQMKNVAKTDLSYGVVKKKYPTFDITKITGIDTIDPRKTDLRDLEIHMASVQELAHETIKHSSACLARAARHPILPLDLRNPSFENFAEHMKFVRNIGWPDENGEMVLASKNAQRNLKKAWERATKAWGTYRVWPTIVVKKCPKRIRVIDLYTPEFAYEMHHYKYHKDRDVNRMIQNLLFFGNIVGLAPEKEWITLDLDDLRFMPDGTARLKATRWKVNNAVRLLRVEATPATSKVHKSLVNLIENTDKFRARAEDALLINPATGHRWTESTLRRFMTKHGQKIDPKFYPYKMRHFCLTARMIEWGTNELALTKVAAWAGHDRLDQTREYIDLALVFNDSRGRWIRRALNRPSDAGQRGDYRTMLLDTRRFSPFLSNVNRRSPR
jgi:hypothetical protein